MVQPQVVVALEPWRAKQFDAAAFYFQGFGWWDKAPFFDSAKSSAFLVLAYV
jgi:hypothetical protein